MTTIHVNIAGGIYDAIDTGDGFVLVKNVPIMGAVAKGVKNAPENIDGAWQKKAVERAQFDYRGGRFAAPIHKGHHKQIAFEDPEFLGFVLPSGVGRMALEGEEQDVMFADYKLKKSAFERAQKGELPYASVEPDWEKGEIQSLALLDSKPPHFKLPLFTGFNLKADPTAKFEAVLKPATMDKPAQVTLEACCGHCSAYEKSMGKKFEGVKMDGTKPDKDDSKPVVPNQPTQMNAEQAAQFAKMQADLALQKDSVAKLEKAALDRENAEKSKTRLDKALSDLKGYELGENARKALFDASTSEPQLAALVAAFKESARREPPSTMEEFMAGSVPVTSPALAKFQKEGNPEKLAKAARYVAQFEVAKSKGMTGTMTAEQWAEVSIAEENRGTNK